MISAQVSSGNAPSLVRGPRLDIPRFETFVPVEFNRLCLGIIGHWDIATKSNLRACSHKSRAPTDFLAQIWRIAVPFAIHRAFEK